MGKYVYPAVFTPDEEGNYKVHFPDLENCAANGKDLSEAMFLAGDALAYALYDYESGEKKVPEPSSTDCIALSEGEFVNLIACDTLEYKKQHSSRAVKKTLTIPEWLNEAATEEGINFSQVLQEALKEKLKFR